MAIGDVKVELVDGGIGRQPKGVDGIHLKIGTAEGGTANKIYKANSFYDAKKILKKGQLLDAIQVYFAEFSQSKKQEPVKIYFAKAESDVDGLIGLVTHTGTGTATYVTTGTVIGQRNFVVEIVEGGPSGTATYRKSSDGGVTWSSEIITPVSESKISVGAGVEIAFTDDSTASESFVTGDKYSFSSTAPSASTASTLACLNAMKQNHEAKFVHVMGGTNKAFWTSVSVIADEWETRYHDHKIFILEAQSRIDTQTVSDWVDARTNESIGFYHKRILLCPISVTSSLLKREINSAWVLCAKIALARVYMSPGYVDQFAFLTASDIKDYDKLSEKDAQNSSYLDKLDNKRLTVCAKYINYPGIYMSHINLMSESTSDFKRMQDLRVADKVRRIVRQAIMKYLESPAHLDAGYGGIDALTVDIDNSISSKMEIKGDIEIAGHTTNIDTEQDVVSTGQVLGSITIQKVGTMEQIEIDLSYAK